MDTNDQQITIIEGPPPMFENVMDEWPYGLNESPLVAELALTRLRTFNGPALVERCHRAWRKQLPMHLVYRNMSGLQEQAPIVAARNVPTGEGDMLMLWVRLANDDIELEFGYEDDADESEEDND